MKPHIDKKLIILTSMLLSILFCLSLIPLFTENTPLCDDNLLIPNTYNSSNISEVFDSILSQNSEIPEVSTKYNVLYKNNNNRLSYIFANPVRNFVDGKYVYCKSEITSKKNDFIIHNEYLNAICTDQQITVSKPNSCAISFNLSNTQSYTIAETYCNIYNDIAESIQYDFESGDSLQVIPTHSGILFEAVPNTSSEIFKYQIDIGNLKYTNSDAGYVILNEKDDTYAIIHRPLVMDSSGTISAFPKIQIESIDQLLYLTLEIPKETQISKLAICVDLYLDKMFYDSSAYENAKNVNSIQNNISIFNNQNKSTDGYTFMKFNMKTYVPSKKELIDSVILNLYVIYAGNETTIEVYSVNNDWCSWTLDWLKKPNLKKQLGEFQITNSGWYSIDLTNYVIDLIDNNYYYLNDSSIVLKIKSGTKGDVIIASTDNTYAPPFFEIKYRVK